MRYLPVALLLFALPSWGADMNVDGVIDALDLAMVAKVVSPRRRPAGRAAGDSSGTTP